MKQPMDLDRARFQQVVQLMVDYPELEVERVRAMLETPTGRRRVEKIRPRSWSEITAGVDSGWVTKNEARRLAGLTQRRGPASKTRRVNNGEGG
jgi:hypothetical protein